MKPAAFLTLPLALALAGCGGVGHTPVVATTTQMADLARNVAGSRTEVGGILTPNADPHGYEPRPHEPLHVAGAGLVPVRVGVGREDPRNLDPRASDVAREIGDMGGRGDDGRVVIAGTAGEQHQQRDEGKQAEHRGRSPY